MKRENRWGSTIDTLGRGWQRKRREGVGSYEVRAKVSHI